MNPYAFHSVFVVCSAVPQGRIAFRAAQSPFFSPVRWGKRAGPMANGALARPETA